MDRNTLEETIQQKQKGILTGSEHWLRKCGRRLGRGAEIEESRRLGELRLNNQQQLVAFEVKETGCWRIPTQEIGLDACAYSLGKLMKSQAGQPNAGNEVGLGNSKVCSNRDAGLCDKEWE